MPFERLQSLKWPSEVSSLDFNADYSVIKLDPSSVQRVSAENRIFIQDNGNNNVLVLSKKLKSLILGVHINYNGSNNVIVIGEDTALCGGINCGSDCIAVIVGHQHSLQLHADLYDGGALFWGRGARTYDCRIWAHGGKRVVIGDDCLFSEGIKILTSDHHSVVSLDDFSQINQPQDVIISEHVWIAFDATILKGVHVGKGAIIGPCALVTRDIPEAEAWGGVPARMIKQNVSWVDSHPANPADIECLRRMFPERRALSPKAPLSAKRIPDVGQSRCEGKIIRRRLGLPLASAGRGENLHDAEDLLPALKLPARRSYADLLRALLQKIGVMARGFFPAVHRLVRKLLA